MFLLTTPGSANKQDELESLEGFARVVPHLISACFLIGHFSFRCSQWKCFKNHRFQPKGQHITTGPFLLLIDAATSESQCVAFKYSRGLLLALLVGTAFSLVCAIHTFLFLLEQPLSLFPENITFVAVEKLQMQITVTIVLLFYSGTSGTASSGSRANTSAHSSLQCPRLYLVCAFFPVAQMPS